MIDPTTTQAKIPLTDKISLTEKGKKVWDILAPQSKYITNKIMDCGLDGHDVLSNLFNEEEWGQLDDLLTHHLFVDENERRTQQLISIISRRRSKDTSVNVRRGK